MNNILSKIILGIILLLLIFSSCRKEVMKPQDMSWSPSIALPIGHSHLSLADAIVPDDSLIFVDSDKFIRFAYKDDSIFSFDVSELIELPEQDMISENYKLGEIILDDFGPNNTELRLDSLIEKVDTATASLIYLMNGTNAVFPSLLTLESDTLKFDDFDEFAEVTFSDGYILLSITNNLPVIIENLEASLQCIINDTNIEISYEIYPLILVGETLIDTIDVSGQTISSNFVIELISLSSPGSGTNIVPIDLSMGLALSISTKNIKVIHGIARIPEQVFTKDTTNIDFGVEGSEKITKIHMSKAIIEYSINTDIQTNVQAELKLPYVLINGFPATHVIDLSNSNINGTWDLSNSIFDLTANTDTGFNILQMEYELKIFASNEYVEFDSSNSVSIDFEINNLEFSLIEGYLDTQIIELDPDTLDLGIDILKDISGGFELSNPSLKINITNSIGLPATIDINMTGKSYENEIVDFESETMIFPAPIFVGDEISETIIIGKESSNIVELIALPPKEIFFSGTIITNPDSTATSTYTNFVTNTSKLNVGIEMDLPLELIVSELILKDTIELNFGEDGILGNNDTQELESALLKIFINNGFPFDLSISVIFADSTNNSHIDSLFIDLLLAAQVDENGKVSESTESNTEVSLDQNRINNIENSNQIIISAKLSTTNNGQQAVKLYLDYSLDVNIAIKATGIIEIQ